MGFRAEGAWCLRGRVYVEIVVCMRGSVIAKLMNAEVC